MNAVAFICEPGTALIDIRLFVTQLQIEQLALP